jgi:hypothetical protein
LRHYELNHNRFENFSTSQHIMESKCRLLINLAAFLLSYVEHLREILMVHLHRAIVAIRETSGQRAFEPLNRCPRHACLVIGRRSRTKDVERAVETMIRAGCERVTVSHDGSLVLLGEMYVEHITKDMGKANLIATIGRTDVSDDLTSQPDAVLLLNDSFTSPVFSSSAITISKSADASLLYYSELIPVYSLNPSDVFLAVSMFQSKSQRFGR